MRARWQARSLVVAAVASTLVAICAQPGVAATLVSDQVVSPTAARFPKNKQNESPMLVSPFNPNVVVTGANDEIEEPDCTLDASGGSQCPFDPETDSTGIYVSTDGGATYATRILDWWPSGGTVSSGDPIVAFGPKPGGASNADGGRLYAGGLAQRPDAAPNQVQLAVAWSDDQGRTWSRPVEISSFDAKVHFNDKPSLWADANPASPHYGTVYAAWTLFFGNGSFGRSNTFSPEPIMFARSTDFGRTWSKAQKIAQFSRNNGAVGGRQGSEIRTGPDGTVYVFWNDAAGKESKLTMARSFDGGRTFERPRYIARILDNASPFPGARFRNASFPSASVSQTTGAVFVTWPDYDPVAGHGVVRLARSTDGGATWSVRTVADVRGRSPFFPAVAASPDGTKAFIGFQTVNDLPAGTPAGIGVVTLDVRYVLSTDGGTTFGAPAVIRANAGDPEASSTNSLTGQFLGDYNGASATDAHAYYSWTDASQAATCEAVTAFRDGTGPRPNIYTSCPAAFGNTDIRVAKIAF
jgi:hypothetical protein